MATDIASKTTSTYTEKLTFTLDFPGRYEHVNGIFCGPLKQTLDPSWASLFSAGARGSSS